MLRHSSHPLGSDGLFRANPLRWEFLRKPSSCLHAPKDRLLITLLAPPSSSDCWEILPHIKGWMATGKNEDGCANGGGSERHVFIFLALAFFCF